MTWTWDELRGLTLARQFPDIVNADVDEVLAQVGPIQSQAARAPFVGLTARAPWLTHAAIEQAYEDAGLVRGSTIRGTVHTMTPAQHAVLDAVTRIGQRRAWERILDLQALPLEDVWAALERYAADRWRTVDELGGELRRVLTESGEPGAVARLDGTSGRYLAFGQGALLRRPASGPWSGQGRAVYRSAEAVHGARRPPAERAIRQAVLLHLRAHGPASRHDLAWWSGLGLRQVDAAIAALELPHRPGPAGQVYLDVADPPTPRDLPGVRLLPEFDATLCGYHPKARERFVTPAHHEVLWRGANGLLAPALLVDGRITGWWRLAGTGQRRPLEVAWFARTRRPRKAELAEAVSVVEAALDVRVTSLAVARSVA